MDVALTFERRNQFAPIEAATVTWWKKQGDEFQAAMRERNQSKIGRMARLRGEIKIANAPAAASAPWSPPWQDPAA
jgi:hypothetical protein